MSLEIVTRYEDQLPEFNDKQFAEQPNGDINLPELEDDEEYWSFIMANAPSIYDQLAPEEYGMWEAKPSSTVAIVSRPISKALEVGQQELQGKALNEHHELLLPTFIHKQIQAAALNENGLSDDSKIMVRYRNSMQMENVREAVEAKLQAEITILMEEVKEKAKPEGYEAPIFFPELPYVPSRSQVLDIMKAINDRPLEEYIRTRFGYADINELTQAFLKAGKYSDRDFELNLQTPMGEMPKEKRNQDQYFEIQSQYYKADQTAKTHLAEKHALSFDEILEVARSASKKTSANAEDNQKNKPYEQRDHFERVCTYLAEISTYYYMSFESDADTSPEEFDVRQLPDHFRHVLLSAASRPDLVGLSPKEGSETAREVIQKFENTIKSGEHSYRPLLDLRRFAQEDLANIMALIDGIQSGDIAMTTIEIKANVQKEKIISLADEEEVPRRYYIEAAHTYFPLMQYLSRTMIQNGRGDQVDDLMDAIISGSNKSLLVRMQAPFVEEGINTNSSKKTTEFVENPDEVQITHKVYELDPLIIRQEMEKQKARYLKRAMNR